MTRRITLSNRRYSQKVLMNKSTRSNKICTVNIDRYLVSDSFIFCTILVSLLPYLVVMVRLYYYFV